MKGYPEYVLKRVRIVQESYLHCLYSAAIHWIARNSHLLIFNIYEYFSPNKVKSIKYLKGSYQFYFWNIKLLTQNAISKRTFGGMNVWLEAFEWYHWRYRLSTAVIKYTFNDLKDLKDTKYAFRTWYEMKKSQLCILSRHK